MFCSGENGIQEFICKSEKAKLILYYTNVGELGKYGDQIVKKIECVLDYLATQPQLFVIWETSETGFQVKETIPEKIYEDYVAIIEKCKCYSNILFVSCTCGYDYAQIADAYYGDYSKYVFSFLLENKPVLIQNKQMQELPKSSQLPKVFLECFIVDGEKIYFSASRENGLFQGNIRTGKVEFKGYFPDEQMKKNHLYQDCVRYVSKLVFIPKRAEHIAIYDMTDEKMESIKLPYMQLLKQNEFPFSRAFVYENFVYFIPNRVPLILKLNMNNYEFTFLTKWYEESKKEMMYPGDILFAGDYSIVGHKCYLPFAQNKMILEIDLSNDEMQFYELECETAFFNTICYDGELFWLTGGMNGILSWNKDTGAEKLYSFPEGYEGGSSPFGYSFYTEGNVILIPASANMAIKINVFHKTACIMQIKDFEEQINMIPKKFRCKQYGEDLFISNLLSGEIICYDSDGKEKAAYCLEYPLAWRREYLLYFRQFNGILLESFENEKDYQQLKFFVEYIMEDSDKIADQYFMNKNNGAYIYRTIADSLL